jgi:nucleoside-diphosphate-sugar epimerase
MLSGLVRVSSTLRRLSLGNLIPIARHAAFSLNTQLYYHHHVMHLNSLFTLQEATLGPAINGTLNVLRSCKKSPFLKRVVLTSSSSAVRIRDETQQPELLWDETTWSSVPLCEKLQVM